MKKYHLDQNNVAFIHCVNGAFAGIYTMLEMAKAHTWLLLLSLNLISL